MSDSVAIVVLTQAGLSIARKIRETVRGAVIHGYRLRVEGADKAFDDVGTHVRALFNNGDSIVGICATGILVRTLASEIVDKTTEPAVLAVAEDGSAVVPILGGHRGANQLGEKIAAALGTTAAITTASEARWRIALDQPPTGLVLANPEHHRAFVAQLLEGKPCRIEGECDWLSSGGLHLQADAALSLVVTESPVAGSESRLVYYRAGVTVGVGCERDTTPQELNALVYETLNEAGVSPKAVAGIFSVDLKSGEPAVHELGATLDCAVRFFDVATLEALTPRLETPSDVVFREIGCHGVAEAAALAGAGEHATLIAPKRKSKRATCSLARAPEPLQVHLIGKPRGRLTVVGLGPGTHGWRTPAADQAVREATHLVGYVGYLDMLGPPSAHQITRPYGLGEETERVDEALSLAGEGHAVALICSGDPGVYAMASLVFERLEQRQSASWNRVETIVLPGVSAMHGAAALSGAPLGHDFCAISLSDLLTPWPAIENRLTAAAQADFVVALYNPASQRRRSGLAKAISILAQHRPADTPVIVARQVGRDEQSITVVSLAELDQDAVDMMTLLIIGSSSTRLLQAGTTQYVYTPRGYEVKNAAEDCR